MSKTMDTKVEQNSHKIDKEFLFKNEYFTPTEDDNRDAQTGYGRAGSIMSINECLLENNKAINTECGSTIVQHAKNV